MTAEKIIRYREEHGRFSSKEELKKVPLSVRAVTRRWRIRSPYDDPAGAFLECAFAGAGVFFSRGFRLFCCLMDMPCCSFPVCFSFSMVYFPSVPLSLSFWTGAFSSDDRRFPHGTL